METMALGTDLAEELEHYRKRCIEFEEKSKQDEVRCLMLEIEVADLKKKNEELEGEIRKGKGVTVDLIDEEIEGDELLQLMIENRVLECEKRKAEIELLSWKEKVEELVSRVHELESKASMNESSMGISIGLGMLTGKTHLDTDSNLISKQKVVEDVKSSVERGNKHEYCSQVRRRLPFDADGCANKKMAPSTPGVAQPPSSGVIYISDEDINNNNEIPKVKKLYDSSNCGALAKSLYSSKNDPNLEHIDEDDMDEDGFEGHSRIAKRKRSSNIISSDDDDDEDMDGILGNSLNTTSAKRKRAPKITTSDNEASYDDDAPICTLRMRRSRRLKIDSEDEVKENVGRKRLRKSGSVCVDENSSSSEGESLGGFIVESSESPESASDDNSCDESEEDVLDDFKLSLDKIRRKKVANTKWDLEGDMLADFGKDPVLCMKAVCALYRQQTADEKACKGTIHQNARGFSQTDASRASKVAEFLMDGDSGGDMNRTVEELKCYDSKGMELCMRLAAKYSKQLFEIYWNKEDPYFLP